jgi:hypothetical protein
MDIDFAHSPSDDESLPDLQTSFENAHARARPPTTPNAQPAPTPVVQPTVTAATPSESTEAETNAAKPAAEPAPSSDAEPSGGRRTHSASFTEMLQICDRCGDIKSEHELDTYWNSRTRQHEFADHCKACAFHIQCADKGGCKNWYPPEAYIRTVGGREADTKRCEHCRATDAARKRAKAARDREARALEEMDADLFPIEWAEFVDLAVSS